MFLEFSGNCCEICWIIWNCKTAIYLNKFVNLTYHIFRCDRLGLLIYYVNLNSLFDTITVPNYNSLLPAMKYALNLTGDRRWNRILYINTPNTRTIVNENSWYFACYTWITSIKSILFTIFDMLKYVEIFFSIHESQIITKNYNNNNMIYDFIIRMM